jgi:hypothetical protein
LSQTGDKRRDLFEWKIGEDDFPAEEPAHAAPPAPDHDRPPSEPRPLGPHFSRRAALLAGGAVLAVLLALGLNPVWQQARLRDDLQAVVAREDAAALARDVDAILASVDPDDARWRSARATLVREWLLVAPPPHPLAWTVPVPGRVLSARQLAYDLARVDVERTFTADVFGRRTQALNYIVPQFYRRGADGWKHIAPPASVWGEQKTFTGARGVGLPGRRRRVRGSARALPGRCPGPGLRAVALPWRSARVNSDHARDARKLAGHV